ncbi:MAG: imidazole glycerol phosphate synthase subunit HisH [Sandaracinaceae bacterium]
MKRVVLVDTSMGNLRSVARALDRAGAEITLSADPEAVRGADRVVVPGQGHFRDCAKALAGGLGEALRAHVDAGRPYLGICLGMQILFERSEEAEDVAGLGLFPGAVRRFADDLVDTDGRALKVPHMGWNVVRGAHPLLDPEAWLYFVHSYHCVPADPSLTVGTAEYGAPFCAAIAKDNVFACQFHPEKSQRAGARVLERFLEDAWS